MGKKAAPQQAFRERLREAMERAGLKQGDLARALRVDAGTVVRSARLGISLISSQESPSTTSAASSGTQTSA